MQVKLIVTLNVEPRDINYAVDSANAAAVARSAIDKVLDVAENHNFGLRHHALEYALESVDVAHH